MNKLTIDKMTANITQTDTRKKAGAAMCVRYGLMKNTTNFHNFMEKNLDIELFDVQAIIKIRTMNLLRVNMIQLY